MATSPLLVHTPLTVTVLRGLSGQIAGISAIADGGQEADPQEIFALLEAALRELEKQLPKDTTSLLDEPV